MDYSVTTLNLRPGTLAPALAKLGEVLPSRAMSGEFLGCFYAEIGALNRIIVLRSFDSHDKLAEDRDKLLGGGDVTGAGDFVTSTSMRAYRPFPEVPPVRPGNFGPFYEVREYGIKIGGMGIVTDVWRKALPVRRAYSANLVTMYALDGDNLPAFMHIWPYQSLDERAAIRAKTVADGIWPPKGTGEQLLSQSSEIFIAAPFSPLK